MDDKIEITAMPPSTEKAGSTIPEDVSMALKEWCDLAIKVREMFVAIGIIA